ncbi:MAG: class I SAM-dependent methyltransferase [Bryobacteraceae bacterium]
MAREELFDLSQQYEDLLRRGLRLSGEDPQYFAEGRLRDLRRQLGPAFRPRRILDFGCGVGGSTPVLLRLFPGAAIVGVDTAEPALERATREHGSALVSFRAVAELRPDASFDLCYVNGVFHHIAPQQRLGAARLVHGCLGAGGFFALFENNPWNPGARMVMARIPFDRDAVPMPPPESRRLVTAAGFRLAQPVRSLFYFPRALRWLRFTEPLLAPLPMGAQYYVLGVK